MAGSDMLRSWPLQMDGDWSGGFVAEKWGTNRVDTNGQGEITVQGNNRLYATTDIDMRDWHEVKYRRFPLVNRELEFTIDLSKVGCGCNAAIYLVAMAHPNADDPSNPAGYCDIQGYDDDRIQPCVELDLLEGNAKAVQTTLHTAAGKGADGRSCNQDGCVANWGKTAATKSMYGPGSLRGIDSSQPFQVSATFRETHSWEGIHTVGSLMDVTLSQSHGNSVRRAHLFDGHSVGGSHTTADGHPRPIPSDDRKRTRQALLNPGVALVLSLWTADDLSWLDGGCDSWVAEGRKVCDLDSTSFTISGLRTTEIPSPPPTPPPPSPSMPPPLPPPSLSFMMMSSAPWVAALALTVVAAWLAFRSTGSTGGQRVKMPVPVPWSSRNQAGTHRAVPSAVDDEEEDVPHVGQIQRI